MRMNRNCKFKELPERSEENHPALVPMQEIMEEIRRSLQRIDYGEVVITIHQRAVVQIEKREKVRFPK